MHLANRLFIFLAALLPLHAMADASVPHTFSSSVPVNASNLNQNFDYLERAVNQVANAAASVTVQNSAESVVSASCPRGRRAISALCFCDPEDGERNFGVLFACGSVNAGGVGGCFPEGTTFSSTKPDPLATIILTCGSSARIRTGAASAGGQPEADDPLKHRTSSQELQSLIDLTRKQSDLMRLKLAE